MQGANDNKQTEGHEWGKDLEKDKKTPPQNLKWLKFFFRTRINALYRIISMLFTYKFLQLVSDFILPSAVSL